MSVLVVVQESLDVAFHVASDEGWGVPASYRESFDLLAHHGVIGQELASSLGGAAQLRNRIAHGYATVDLDRLWAELPQGVSAFEQFVAAIARHVASGDS